MKSNKKNIINKVSFWGLLGLILFTASCKKFTQLQPLDAISETVAFDNPANVELVMNGVYQQAAIGTYSGSSGRGYPFGSASIQQSEMRGQDMVNMATFYQFTYEATYSTSTANNINYWENLYNLINQANVFIDGVRKAGASGVITADQAKSYEGEARFLRALAHHELVINFSKPYADGAGSKPGVPYRDTPINTPAAVQAALLVHRGTVAEDYVKILADLDFAEAALPATQPNGYQRATKGAAIALKTRVKLHKADWAGVVTEGAKLGASGNGPYTSPIASYALTASPETPFTSFDNNTESIFSIGNSTTSNPDVNGSLVSMFAPPLVGARGLVATSPNFYNSSYWVAGDKRKTLLQIKGTNGVYYNYKYRLASTNADWAPIIRYAEVLLNVSEAAQRAGNPSLSLNLLNAVRNRSVPVANQFVTAPANLLGAILNERRVEFAGEGRRWADITRLALDPTYSVGGIPAKVRNTQVVAAAFDGTTQLVPAIAAIPYTDFRFLWPFPLSETNSNPLMYNERNPGY